MSTDAADIAVVSFERFLNGDDAAQRAVAKEIYDAFSTVGWVYIKDHGIPQSRVDSIFELVWRIVRSIQCGAILTRATGKNLLRTPHREEMLLAPQRCRSEPRLHGRRR